MHILIWTGGALGDNVGYRALDSLVQFITHGRGTHAAFLRTDGITVHEAFYPKVRDRKLTSADRQNAKAFRLANVTGREDATFEHLFDANLKRGIEYSIEDLFRFALNMPSRDEFHTFCSRYVLHCCNALVPEWKMPLVRIPDGDWASPRDLMISPLLIPVTWNQIDLAITENARKRWQQA